MPNLHAHYYHGNLKAFRQELDGTGASAAQARQAERGSGAGGGGGGSGSAGGGTSFGKSWTMSGIGGGQGPVKADPNERDQFGRTVLHLAATSSTQQAWSFFLVLLRNPHISVNIQDQESGYTALHRALFAGNIRAARELLLRNDCDASIRDLEGMTAFELYNGTVDGTNPASDADGTDLFAWGVNRNFALGTGDSSDKAFPDRINLLTQRQASDQPDPAQRFHHVGVKDVVMAKLHTGVVTAELRGNLSLCGFGSNGRLGRTVHSQLSLLPMSDLPHTIAQVALGQDHTLALTSGGYILSWGHNRFAQLGYAIDLPDRPIGLGKEDPDLQVSPRRIVGPLKKEWVKGVAAGRLSSACWTEDTVWTWGTNTGQLGYEKAANPMQILPRKVTQLSQPVIGIALSDYAMICLLDNFDVLCFHHDTTFKITFTTPRILSDAFPFRPPQSTLRPAIKKVTSCGNTFAALSSIGDVFTFSLPNPMEESSKEARDRHVTVKPQLIWALRKRFTAVKDVALGSDGTVIICTHAGHVYIRQRTKAGSGSFKFKHIPYLQRIIRVATNESGAFAAIRVDAKPRPITLTGKTLEEDLFLLQPHFQRFEHQMTAEDFETGKIKVEEDEDDEGSNSVVKDTAIAFKLCTILRRWRSSETDSLFSWSEPLLGSDISLVVNDLAIPAHSTILAIRVPALAKLLSGGKLDRFSMSKTNRSAIVVQACHPLVVLLLLQYIYSADIAAIWDSRVARAVQGKYADLKLPHAQTKADLKALADVLGISTLSTILESAGKVAMPNRTLSTDVQAFFDRTYCAPSSATDVTLLLADDREVHCSSIILRSRCPFFEAMFADSEWTVSRQEGRDGTVTVRMTHLKWRPMKLVFRYLHEGTEDDLFDYLHQETMDEFLDFVFEVLAAATELLLDRLVLICSRVITRHCNVYNAASLACEANFYQATILKSSIFDYILASMETMLESGLLDDMDEETLADLSQAVGIAQTRKLSVSREQVLVKMAMENQKEWLALQDIPVPRVRQVWKWKPRSPALSPVDPFTSTVVKPRQRIPSSPLQSPDMPPITASSTIDDIFSMDEESASPSIDGRITPRSSRPMTPLDLGAAPSRLGGVGGGPVWKSAAVETQRADLRSIMAEASATKTPSRPVAARQLVPGGAPGSTGKRTPGVASGPSPVLTPSKAPLLARSPPSSSSAAGAWRAVDTKKTSLATVQAQQGFTIPSSPASSSRPGQSSPIPQRTPSASKPTAITAVRPSATPTSAPRKSSGPAWSAATSSSFAPPPRPPIFTGPSSPTASTSSTIPTQSFSLLAIQQEERDYAEMSSRPQVKKSLMQIQKEEREWQDAKAKEEEFMRWWEEEQARVVKESGGAGGGGSSGAGGGGKGSGGAASERGGRGGGRGGRGGQKRVPPTRGRGEKQPMLNGAIRPESGASGSPRPNSSGHSQARPSTVMTGPARDPPAQPTPSKAGLQASAPAFVPPVQINGTRRPPPPNSPAIGPGSGPGQGRGGHLNGTSQSSRGRFPS